VSSRLPWVNLRRGGRHLCLKPAEGYLPPHFGGRGTQRTICFLRNTLARQGIGSGQFPDYPINRDLDEAVICVWFLRSFTQRATLLRLVLLAEALIRRLRSQ